MIKMELSTSSVAVSVISALIAFASLSFTVWNYFKTRRFSELRYEISELSDFKIPPAFIEQLTHAPMALRIKSTRQ